MAVTHITFNDQTQYGRMLRRGLSNLEEGRDILNDVIGTIDMMKNGDGSQAAHFAYATPKFGCSTDADMKALYDEVQSLMFKLNTDASVTSMNSALLQAFNKFR